MRILANLGLILMSMLLSFVALEVGARLLGVEATSMSPKEISSRIVDGVSLWGDKYARYSDRDVSRTTATAEAFTILGLGDSILYGVQLQKEQTYLEQTRGLLADEVNTSFAVLNLAVPGYNTAQESIAFREVSDRIQPDLVLVHYWEDDDQQYRLIGSHVMDLGDVSEEQANLLTQPLPLPSILSDFLVMHSRLYDILGRFRATGEPRPQAEDWAAVSKPLAEIQERAESSGGRLLILASPALDHETPRSNGDLPRLKTFAQARGIELIDLAEWLPDVRSKEIALDACHLNALGHRLLARQFATYLKSHDLKKWAVRDGL